MVSNPSFWNRLYNAVREIPLLGPILQLIWSRKAVLVAAFMGWLITQLPALQPYQENVAAVVAAIVSLALVVVANILGIALEDAAAKRSGTF